jgi:poly(3-hydroxybutyrate) depolymerase
MNKAFYILCILSLLSFQQEEAKAQLSLNCNNSVHAKANGNSDDQFRTVRVTHSLIGLKSTTLTRSYILKHSRSKCGKASDPYQKLVVVFHGGGGSACSMRDGVAINTAAGVGGKHSAPLVTTDCINNKKTLYVFPNGLRSSDHPNYKKNGSLIFNPDVYLASGTASVNSRQFNDGRDPNNPLKESDFIKKIYKQLDGTKVNNTLVKLDGTIYTAGHSNGGIMQWKNMAEEPRVAAMFLSAGLMPEPVAKKYKFRSQQAHIFIVHGKQETMQLFEGTPGKMLGAHETLKHIAVQYGYRPSEAKSYVYPERGSHAHLTPSDKNGNTMKDTWYLKDRRKMLFLTELGKRGVPNGPGHGPGHCWHGHTKRISLKINGEQVTEHCTTKFASTFWMIYSFTEADKWDAKWKLR